MYRNILAIQYEAGNRMAPEGNCLQYHTASSGTFASFAWDFATYGEAQAATTTGIAPYTQFHLANQHYNVCFRREQGKTAICYTPKILGNRFKPLLCLKKPFQEVQQMLEPLHNQHQLQHRLDLEGQEATMQRQLEQPSRLMEL